jgi:hypothetical protein
LDFEAFTIEAHLVYTIKLLRLWIAYGLFMRQGLNKREESVVSDPARADLEWEKEVIIKKEIQEKVGDKLFWI